MKDRLWTKQYLLVIVTNFLLYVVYYQLMLWTTSYAMHVWNLKTVESTLSQIRRRRARGTSGLWPSSP